MTNTLRPVLELMNFHFKQAHGDITVIGTWWMGDQDEEPCLVFIRTSDLGNRHERVMPYVIRLGSAWVYDEETGSPEGAARTVMGIIDSLGLTENRANAFRVASIIRSHLSDLVTIPPRPDMNRRVVADITMTDRDSGATKHIEVSDDV